MSCVDSQVVDLNDLHNRSTVQFGDPIWLVVRERELTVSVYGSAADRFV